MRALETVGIPIEYVHHEVGPSQHEIDMRFSDALSMADHTVTYRLIVKEIAKKAGFHATFMPKPIFGENGSGMHTHQSLFKEGRNAFFDAEDEWHLSVTGKAFIAGQLRHAREITAVFAQWVNSYKRLVPGYEAPVYVAWSRRNRSALIRIPLYKPGAEQATRAEIRCPDPACNPYLTFAVLLHAGLEGIEQGYELPDPMETNLYHLTADQRRERGIVALPETLGEAVRQLYRHRHQLWTRDGRDDRLRPAPGAHRGGPGHDRGYRSGGARRAAQAVHRALLRGDLGLPLRRRGVHRGVEPADRPRARGRRGGAGGERVAGARGRDRRERGDPERAADLLRRVDQPGGETRLGGLHACQRRDRDGNEREADAEPDASSKSPTGSESPRSSPRAKCASNSDLCSSGNSRG